MNVTGKAKVYNFENKGNYAKASLQVGKKKPDGEWENMWFNAKFVGKNTPDDIKKGEQINITSAILESFKGDKGTYVTVVIFEFESKGGVTPVDEIKDCPDCGLPVEQCDCSLPF
jgi:hypothetical protein